MILSLIVFFLFIVAFAELVHVFDWGAKNANYTEWAVAHEFRTLDRRKYRVYNDVLVLSGGRTETAQIDHVIISPYGIFCVETKGFKGLIFGTTTHKYWTRVYYKKKDKFYNPVWQNYGHTKALEAVFGNHMLKAPIVSIVIFSRADKLKLDGPIDGVGYMGAMLQKIRSYTKEIYTQEECYNLCQKLYLANIQDPAQRKAHVKDVNALQQPDAGQPIGASISIKR